MFSTKAHSIKRQAGLAVALSWIGGYTNVITVIYCASLTSHMTGNTTNSVVALVNGKHAEWIHFLTLVAAFVAGASSSAIMMELSALFNFKSKYVLPLFVEASLLTSIVCFHGFFSSFETARADNFTPLLAALAMGMQNATITNISGNVVRTTHVTGVLTDLSIAAVQWIAWLSRKSPEPLPAGNGTQRAIDHPAAKRLFVLFSILNSFALGAALAAWIYPRFGLVSFIGPIGCLLALIYVDWRKPLAEIKPLDVVNDPIVRQHELEESHFPPHIAVVHVAHSSNAEHRAPDFDVYLNSISARKTVVILLFSPKTLLDANSILGLEKVIREFKASKKTLLLAGITAQHYTAFRSYNFVEKIGRDCIHSDLEFALAHARSIAPSTA